MRAPSSSSNRPPTPPVQLTPRQRSARSLTVFIREFNDPGCQDVREVGGKAAGLAQMTAEGLPVAPGFEVTAAAYRAYLEADGLKEFTRSVLEGLGSGRDQAAFDDAAH